MLSRETTQKYRTKFGSAITRTSKVRDSKMRLCNIRSSYPFGSAFIQSKNLSISEGVETIIDIRSHH